MKRKLTALLALAAVATLAAVAASRITIFAVAPMGILPEGKTLIIARTDKTRFIDSADAVCERNFGGTNLLCRGATLAAVAQTATVYAKLPYSEIVYKISTGGKTYGG